jgi:hypothetical protein
MEFQNVLFVLVCCVLVKTGVGAHTVQNPAPADEYSLRYMSLSPAEIVEKSQKIKIKWNFKMFYLF